MKWGIVMYTVEKTYTADMGHRIHNQKLDSEFTENNSKILKCRRFHGHTFELKVRLVSNDLIDDMVLDYNELGFVKKFIDDVMDHRTLISRSDPVLDKVVSKVYSEYNENKQIKYIDTGWDCFKIDLDGISDSDIREYLDCFVVVDFTTSSENISKWVYDLVCNVVRKYNQKNGTDVKVFSVSYKETPKSEAVYFG